MYCFLKSSPLHIPAQDLLHVVHQGVASVVIPSLICAHLESKDPNITLKRMDELLSGPVFEHYRSWCAERSPLVSACSHRFSAARFGKEKWASSPDLASLYKASVVKHLMFWCADYLRSERDEAVSGSDDRLYTMHSFAKFQQLLDVHGPWFSEDECKLVVTYGWAGVMFYQKLAAQDRLRLDSRRCFKITPKFHSFVEMLIYIEQTRRNVRCSGKVFLYFPLSAGF